MRVIDFSVQMMQNEMLEHRESQLHCLQAHHSCEMSKIMQDVSEPTLSLWHLVQQQHVEFLQHIDAGQVGGYLLQLAT